jgi:hypothetical protein
MNFFRVRWLWLLVVSVSLLVGAEGQYSFHLIDDFEGAKLDKWYKFGNVTLQIEENLSSEAGTLDTVAQSCGSYFLKLKGRSDNWYGGGVGADLNVDASNFLRFQLDTYGSGSGGKIKVEVFDDDNGNSILEQDPARDWLPTKDDKWVTEVSVLGKGFTRTSIPFTAFKLENPGFGDGIWNPDLKTSSGGLLKIQMVLLTGKKEGSVEVGVDNILLTR